MQRLYGGGRQFQLRRRYGIDEVDFAWMLLQQDGRCAVCRVSPGRHVDHDHLTGRVRGLLCFNCNAALGLVNDDVDLMKGLIDYLAGHR